MLTSVQKAAVTVSGVALLLSVVALVMVLTTPDDAGANIGAGLVLLLVALCSFVGAGLMMSTGPRTARLAAGASAVAWVVYLALAPNDLGPRWLAVGLLVTAVLTLAAGAGLVLAERRRRSR